MTRYRKILIHYFSGTGNAKNVALAVAQQAESAGIEAQVIHIATVNRRNIPEPAQDSLVVFVSPVHGFNYPPIMLLYIARFPRGRNDVVLMNTRAGMLLGKWVTPGASGISLYLSALILKLKGYRMRALFPVDLPSNWMSVHPGLNAPTVNYLYEKALPKVRQLVEHVLNGGRDFWTLRWLVVDLLLAPISLIYLLWGRFIIAKTFYASKDCNQCGLCVSQCPVQAIQTREGRPFWTFHCESCMKCMGSCPKRAIETGHGMLLVPVLAFGWGFTVLEAHIFNALPLLKNGWINFVFKNGLLILALWLGYRLFHWMLRYRWFERLAVYTSLTRLKFWSRYKETKRV